MIKVIKEKPQLEKKKHKIEFAKEYKETSEGNQTMIAIKWTCEELAKEK